MKNIVLFSVVLTIAFCSCHKKEKPTPEDNRQYSYWTVNEDSFSTNQVYSTIGKAIAAITSDGFENGFDITFNFGYELPKNGSFQIDCDSYSPDYICISIVYNGVGYHKTSVPAYLQASEANGKAQYTLQPTWFYNAQDPSDSVLISGIFNEP